MGVEALWAAWEACPEGCMPLILGDLNVNFGEPRDERDEVIRDLIDDGRRGKGRCTTHSQIISWCAIGTAGDFGT
jgi:hypothetical protein